MTMPSMRCRTAEVISKAAKVRHEDHRVGSKVNIGRCIMYERHVLAYLISIADARRNLLDRFGRT